MKWSILACSLLFAMATEARSQSNYTYVESEQVLVDRATGLKWQCGFGLQWSYANYFPATYDNAKDVCPGVYALSPYGVPGGWRLPTTAELLDASRKGLIDEQFQLAVLLGLADPNEQNDQDHWRQWPFWGIDSKATKRDAFYVVLGTGQKIKTLRRSQLYVLLVR